MLLKYIEQYSQFEHFSHIILDEIHERNIEMDFLLIFIRRLIKLRSDLKVVLMRSVGTQIVDNIRCIEN